MVIRTVFKRPDVQILDDEMNHSFYQEWGGTCFPTEFQRFSIMHNTVLIEKEISVENLRTLR